MTAATAAAFRPRSPIDQIAHIRWWPRDIDQELVFHAIDDGANHRAPNGRSPRAGGRHRAAESVTHAQDRTAGSRSSSAPASIIDADPGDVAMLIRRLARTRQGACRCPRLRAYAPAKADCTRPAAGWVGVGVSSAGRSRGQRVGGGAVAFKSTTSGGWRSELRQVRRRGRVPIEDPDVTATIDTTTSPAVTANFHPATRGGV